jgi:DNA-binding GntR family transcriptional regulator
LPRPIIIPDVMALETLADVRILVEKHPAEEYRSKFTWRQLAGLLKRAAEGQQDVAEVSTALKIVLQLEGVRCQ